MELNINPNCCRTFSLEDEDNFSNISHLSCGINNNLNSHYNNSDSECSGPKSVRDMIQLYNKQCQKDETKPINAKIKYKHNACNRRPPNHSQHLLAATKSSYCGLNSYGSHAKQFVDPIDQKSSQANDEPNTCCKKCSSCMCCQNRNHINSSTTKMLSSTSLSSSTWLLQQNNENIPIKTSNNNNRKCCISSKNCSCSSSNSNCNKINANNDTENSSHHHILVVENCSTHNDEAKAAYNKANAPILNAYNTTELNKALSNNNHNNGYFNKNNSQFVVEKTKQLLQQQQQQQYSKNHLLSTDSVEEANICHEEIPIETSYQSKTTIAKTSSGVRIIIDIFFDQERCSANSNDIVGSRVETDIPQSRILTEFQQQSMSAVKTYKNNDTI